MIVPQTTMLQFLVIHHNFCLSVNCKGTFGLQIYGCLPQVAYLGFVVPGARNKMASLNFFAKRLTQFKNYATKSDVAPPRSGN